MRRPKIFFTVICLMSAIILMPAASHAVSWLNDITTGINRGASSGKPVMIDFYADWCHWCRKLDSETYSDAKVKELLTNFICVKINGDKKPDLVSRYAVKGYPTVVFLDTEGDEISRVSGYLGPDEMAEKMSVVLAHLHLNPQKAQAKKASQGGWGNVITRWWENLKNGGKTKPAPAEEPAQETAVSAKPEVEQTVTASEQASPVSVKSVVYNDLIILNSGNKIQGLISEEKDDLCVVKLPRGEVTLKRSDIKEIKKLVPEEACLMMGDRFVGDRNFDEGIEEYRKALKINPGYKPAKDAIAAAKRKKIEYAQALKALEEEKNQEEEKKKTAETATIVERPSVEKYSCYVNIGHSNIPVRKNYTLRDFGISVTNEMVINEFPPPESGFLRNRIQSVSTSAAQDAGLRLGDRIVAINGRSAAGLTPYDAEKLIGSHRYIKVTVERAPLP